MLIAFTNRSVCNSDPIREVAMDEIETRAVILRRPFQKRLIKDCILDQTSIQLLCCWLTPQEYRQITGSFPTVSPLNHCQRFSHSLTLRYSAIAESLSNLDVIGYN